MSRSTSVRDMTVGSPTKHILLFALPLILGNLFQQLYTLVDSIIVGQYVGEDALAAIGACGSMNFLFFSLSAGLAIGIGVIVAQYFGARDEENVRVTIANSFYVIMTVSVCVMLISFFAAPWLLRVLETPENVIEDATTYIHVTILGILGIATYNLLAAILRALGDSRTPLYFLILSSLINVAGDLLFVLVFDMSVFGVALATILSQYISAISCYIYAYYRIPYFRLDKRYRKPNASIIKKSFRIGIPIALQNSMIAVSCMALQRFVNTFGSTVMAAFAITSRVEQLVQQPYGSLGMALTSYCGQNMGAGKLDRVKKGFHKAIIMVFIFSLIMLPLFYIFGESIVSVFVKKESQEAIEIGTKALRITSLFYFGLGMIYVPRGVLNGSGDTKFGMINGIAEVTCRFIYAPIFTSIASIGYWGLWLTSGATWGTTAIVCCLRYVTGGWKNKAIVENKNTENV